MSVKQPTKLIIIESTHKAPFFEKALGEEFRIISCTGIISAIPYIFLIMFKQELTPKHREALGKIQKIINNGNFEEIIIATEGDKLGKKYENRLLKNLKFIRNTKRTAVVSYDKQGIQDAVLKAKLIQKNINYLQGENPIPAVSSQP